jgi:hypothetical protein
MSDAVSDLERIKEKVYEGREAIREARLILEDRELDEKRAKIKQHLYDAEDYADFALHLIDPNLVS